MADKRRIQRLETSILQTVGPLISHGLSDPRLALVTVTRIKLSPDLSVARVNWSSLADPAERSKAAHALEHARGHLQGAVAKNLRTRITPRLEFHYDDSIEKATRVSTILDRIASERAERGSAEFLDDRTMRFVRPVSAEPARVWRAITDETELAAWFMPSKLDLRVGGECAFNLPQPFGGKITELDPPRVLHVEQDGNAYLRFEVDEGKVSFTDRMLANESPPAGSDEPSSYQPGGPGTLWAGVAAGWHNFLDRLAAHVEEQPMPADEAYGQLVEQYVGILRKRFES